MFFNLGIRAFVLCATICVRSSQCVYLERERGIVKEVLNSILKDLDAAAQNVLDDPGVLDEFSRKATAAFQNLELATHKSEDKKRISDCFEKHYVPLLSDWGKVTTHGLEQCASTTLADLHQLKDYLLVSSQKLSKAADSVRAITTTCYSKKLKTNHESLACLKTYKKTANGFINLYQELIADVEKAKNLYTHSEINGRLCVKKVLKETGIDFFYFMDTVEKCLNKR